MPSRLLAKNANVSRDRLFWLIASAMVVGLSVAFWMLCSHQVRMAQLRDAAAKAERIAIADCLRYSAGASLSSCAASVAPNRDAARVTVAQDNRGAGAGALSTQMSTPVPVNYVYR